jgi:hypothetical protein
MINRPKRKLIPNILYFKSIIYPPKAIAKDTGRLAGSAMKGAVGIGL